MSTVSRFPVARPDCCDPLLDIGSELFVVADSLSARQRPEKISCCAKVLRIEVPLVLQVAIFANRSAKAGLYSSRSSRVIPC
jgi:hypothetical protein